MAGSLVKDTIPWLLLLDAKLVPLGGSGVLSQHAIDQMIQLGEVPDENSNGLFTQLSPDCDKAASESVFSSSCESTRPWLPSASQQNSLRSGLFVPEHDTSVDDFTLNIKGNLLRDAASFHFAAECLVRPIATLDRHHRARGSEPDELEVSAIAEKLVLKLRDLWNRRPRVLDCGIQELRAILQIELATEIAQGLCRYRACFWAHFCYLYRIAWWHQPRTEESRVVLDTMWRDIRASVGLLPELFTVKDLSYQSSRSKSSLIHAMITWPLYLFSIESPDHEKANWCIEKVSELGQLEGDIGPHGEHASVNASQIARLMREVIEQQNRKNTRVDSRFIALEMFGYTFPIV